jgi:hypothetical protein
MKIGAGMTDYRLFRLFTRPSFLRQDYNLWKFLKRGLGLENRK